MLKRGEIFFGRKVVLEALEEGRALERIFLRTGSSGDITRRIEQKASDGNIPVSRVPAAKLNRLTNLNHQGVVALVSPIGFHRLEDIVDHCFARGSDPLILVLDGITDVGNFGAICRTALGLEVDAVVIGHYRSAPVNAQSVKTSAGALLKIPVCRYRDLGGAVEYLRSCGLRILALDGSGDTVLRAADTAGPMALIMGAEGDGISRQLLAEADMVVRLPQSDQLESYNVSVAAAMALYEIRRGGGA